MRIDGLFPRVLASRRARPVRVPEGMAVVAVGGARWGGSGKTPLAIACARALAEMGIATALIGHAYRARPDRARSVSPGDRLSEVGDEALVAAAHLAPLGVDVVVAPRRHFGLQADRSSALELARRHGADVAVLDGPLQIAPRRADLALLATDAAAPRRLLAWCDHAVRVDDHASRGARRANGELVSFAELSTMRLGLFTALARPSRLVASLERRGVVPQVVVDAGDHGRDAAAAARLVDEARRRGLDGVIASEKCAIHLGGAGFVAPTFVLEHGFVAPPDLTRLLWASFRHHARPRAPDASGISPEAADAPSAPLTGSSEGNSLIL